MKKLLAIILFSPSFFLAQKDTWDYIGNISFDEKTDRKDFILCDENHVYQYFNDSEGYLYDGEKLAIEEEFQKKYNQTIVKKENAWVRIRFIVNCFGRTDRFRLLTANYNYEPIEIDKNITSQLLEITKNLSGWIPKKIKEQKIDYYQYLTFKIKDGKIDEILP